MMWGCPPASGYFLAVLAPATPGSSMIRSIRRSGRTLLSRAQSQAGSPPTFATTYRVRGELLRIASMIASVLTCVPRPRLKGVKG